MEDTNLTINQVISLAANTLNVMDAAAVFGLRTEMEGIVRILKSSKTLRDWS
jgi:hypothetical protein